jgi:hypothetical protein
MENDESSSHPSCHRMNENVERVWNMIYSDRCLSIGAVALQLNLDKEAVKKA